MVGPEPIVVEIGKNGFTDAAGTGANLIGAFPNTLFFNTDGELVFAHQGEYADQAALEADIQKYALE